jgi:hypothetical protein
MPPQFIECRFRPTDQRSYCYHNDGEPAAVGDMVVVHSRRSSRSPAVETTVEVVALVEQPPFATKPIIGPVEADDQDGWHSDADEGAR